MSRRRRQIPICPRRVMLDHMETRQREAGPAGPAHPSRPGRLGAPTARRWRGALKTTRRKNSIAISASFLWQARPERPRAGPQGFERAGAAAAPRGGSGETEPILCVPEMGAETNRPQDASTRNRRAPQGHLRQKGAYQMQSSRVRLMLIALLGVFAFSAVAAAAAQAEEAPFWSIGGTRLEEGKTHYISVKGYNVTGQTAGYRIGTSTGQAIRCPFIRLKEGVLLGSKAGNPGTNDEVIELFGEAGNPCVVEGNGTGCKVKEPIITNPVKSELVESEKSTTAALLVEFFTTSGPLGVLTFEGTGCVVKETTVSGKLAGEVREDPNNGTLGGVVKLPNEKKEAKSWLLNFPTTPIHHVWLIKGGLGEETKIELLSFAAESTLSGTALILLANAKKETEETLWSPLP